MYIFLIINSFCRSTGTILVPYARQMSPAANFWIWNSTATIWGEVAYLLLPLLLNAPESGNSTEPLANFYVRKPARQPRPQNGMAFQTESCVIPVKEFQTQLQRPNIGTSLVVNKEEYK